MKCRECTFMSDFGDGLYRCTNHDSIHYMEYTGVCCEDECDDGEYLVPQEQEEGRPGGQEVIIEADVVKAISETMVCKKCPYPCKAKENSSMANCVFHWTEILSRINPNVDWKEVRYRVSYMKEGGSDVRRCP